MLFILLNLFNFVVNNKDWIGIIILYFNIHSNLNFLYYTDVQVNSCLYLLSRERCIENENKRQ